MKIYMIGTGAVGGYFGSLLHQFGVDVTFVGTRESAKKIKANGLIVNGISYPVKITDDFDHITDANLILLAVKSYHFPEVVPQLDRISPKTIVICLQNGIDNDLTAKNLAPNLNVHPGLVYVSAQKVAPGVISQSGSQKTLIFGRRDKKHDPKFVAIETVLCDSDIDAQNSMDIEKDLWHKFIFVVSFAAVTAKFRVDIGTTLSHPIMKNFYCQSIREVIRIAQAEGIVLDHDIYTQIITKAKRFPGTTKSSLLVDLENGRQTEIETLHGTVVRLAQKYNLPVPTIQDVYWSVSGWSSVNNNLRS